jgi:hypothetical protein
MKHLESFPIPAFEQRDYYTVEQAATKQHAKGSFVSSFGVA